MLSGGTTPITFVLDAVMPGRCYETLLFSPIMIVMHEFLLRFMHSSSEITIDLCLWAVTLVGA